MRELMIIGPLISKNVLGGGLLVLCPGSPEGRAAGVCGHQYSLELLLLGCWKRGHRVRFSHSLAVLILVIPLQQPGNVSIEPSWGKKRCPARILNTMNEITLLELF